MLEILVVDDSQFDRAVVMKVLRKLGNWHAEYLSSGEEALRRIEEQKFDLVLTDLHMPGMNGLTLLERIRELEHPVPVVVMSSRGSEDAAIQALRLGAANYVVKKNMIHDLPGIVDSVIHSARSVQTETALLGHLQRSLFHFTIPNNRTLVRGAISFVQGLAEKFGKIPEADRIRLGICLEESLLNAMIHGNLEVSSALREDGSDEYDKQIDLRLGQYPYCDRMIDIDLAFSSESLVFTIRDEGPGFDIQSVPDPTNPENLCKPSGRGLLLIRLFMDEVHHNEQGNTITMVKRLKAVEPVETSVIETMTDAVLAG